MRLPFLLDDFCRHAWASAAARALWEPRLQTIGDAWARLERETVARGDRRAALQTMPAADVPALADAMKRRGVLVITLDRVAHLGHYGAETPGAMGEASDQRLAIVHHADAGAWQSAWAARDDDAMGTLLGYPACCRAFFDATWGARSVDPTFEQAQATLAASREGHAIALPGGHGATNVLGRWMGVRAVPHLPCSFDCEATRVFGEAFKAAALALDLGEAWGWIEQILAWPVRWSAVHGIAEIVTPVWKIAARSDAWTERREVTLDGTVAGTGQPEDLWTLNGFRSAAAMREAHDVLANAVRQAWAAPHSVLDLGCGNGQLARRLAPVRCGVDHNAAALAQARRLDATGTYLPADVLDAAAWADRSAVLTVFMAGRILEASEAQRHALGAALEGRVVLAYLYGDWMARTSVDGALAAAGLIVDRDKPSGTSARAGVAAATVGRLRRAA